MCLALKANHGGSNCNASKRQNKSGSLVGNAQIVAAMARCASCEGDYCSLVEKELGELKSHWRMCGNYCSSKQMLPCFRKIAYRSCFVCILEPMSRKRNV